MSDNLYTKKRSAQFRGPTTSDDYNARIEETYKDLVYQSNKVGTLEEDFRKSYQRLLKDHFALTKTLEDLEARVYTLEASYNRLLFSNSNQIENSRFVNTAYEVPSVNQCFYDYQHSVLTLPKVESSSISKLKFVNPDGAEIIPSTFETIVRGDTSTADTVGAVIDSSDPYFAVVSQAGKVWERNVIANSPNPNGAIVTLYIQMPSDLSVVSDSNVIILHPYPATGCDLIDVAYSVKHDIALAESDGYLPLNRLAIHSGNPNAVGWVPPGSWTGDQIINSGPKAFYTDPKAITALRITLRQNNYFVESAKYVYTYGLSRLDVRYDKLLDAGKAIIRFDAKPGTTITNIEDIQPEIWNVAEGELPDIFEYRIIWETSLDSGVYTNIPVPLSTRVWVEVTLNKTLSKGTPALSGLIVNYS